MATGRNISFALAWQDAWGAAAASGDAAWAFNAEAGDLGPVPTEPREPAPLMGLGGAEVDPIAGAHDVSHTFNLPLCARQAGLWIKGLMGAATSSAAVGSRGGFLFRRQPVAADTITVGETTFTFVSGTPSTDEIQIGATLLATVAAAATAVDGETGISAEAHGPILWITHDTADDTGDDVVTSASAPGRAQPFAATLKGGGYFRHLWRSEASVARPCASVEVTHSDVASPSTYRFTDSMMVGGLTLAKQRSGRVTMSAEVIARRGVEGGSRTLAASPTALTVMQFSQASGSILLGGECIGSIESAEISLGVDLHPGGMSACGGDDYAVIGEPLVGDTTAGLTLTGRFPTSVLHAAAFAGTPVEVELVFINAQSGAALFVTLPRVWLDKPQMSAEGRGQVLASFTGRGIVDPSAGYRYQAELYSPVAGWPAA